MEWILILYFIGPYPGMAGATTATFSDEAACRAAITAVEAAADNKPFIKLAICIPEASK